MGAEPACLPVRLFHSFSILAVLLVPLAAQAQDATAQHLADLRLASAVRLALATDARTRGLDVDVTARGGTVTLAGGLAAVERRAAADVARAVPGVAGVAGEGASPPAVVAPRAAASVAVSPDRASAPSAERPALREEGDVAYHTVARGETLFSLARAYGTTVDAVVRLNSLSGPEIRVGQRLRMR